MDFLTTLNVPFGVVFILPLLWIIGVGMLIVRTNRLNSNNHDIRITDNVFNGGDGIMPPENPFDARLDRQLDLDQRYDDDFLEGLRNDNYHQQNIYHR
ncbi:MAG: hypothetical protein L3J58_13080 [Emcibacter sp.]|nr:hypothetical protein [Emcibacter sp.]